MPYRSASKCLVGSPLQTIAFKKAMNPFDHRIRPDQTLKYATPQTFKAAYEGRMIPKSWVHNFESTSSSQSLHLLRLPLGQESPGKPRLFEKTPPVFRQEIRNTGGVILAAGEGFEPSHTESESAVLPLHKPAISVRDSEQILLYRKVILCQGVFQILFLFLSSPSA